MPLQGSPHQVEEVPGKERKDPMRRRRHEDERDESPDLALEDPFANEPQPREDVVLPNLSGDERQDLPQDDYQGHVRHGVATEPGFETGNPLHPSTTRDLNRIGRNAQGEARVFRPLHPECQRRQSDIGRLRSALRARLCFLACVRGSRRRIRPGAADHAVEDPKARTDHEPHRRVREHDRSIEGQPRGNAPQPHDDRQ